MKTTGQGLSVGGAILTVAGIAVYVSGLNEIDLDNTGEDKGAGKVLGGFVLMVAGEAALATGITLWIVGGIKSGRYQRLMKKGDKKLSLGFTKDGIGLQFHF